MPLISVLFQLLFSEWVTSAKRYRVNFAQRRSPEQRFQTAREVKTALEWAMEPHAASAPKTSRRWQWIAALALIAIGALSGWAVAHFRQPAAADRVLRLDISPPEGSRFVALGLWAGGAALSPDGKMVAFVARSTGKPGCGCGL